MIRAGVLVGLVGCSTATAPYEAPAADASTVVACPGASEITPTVAMFHLDVQEWGYFEESVDVITRVLDLHESLCVPLDVFLTTWMVDRLDAEAPALLARLFASDLVSIDYHTRPPLPYRADFADVDGHDYYGLWSMGTSAQLDTIRDFETHGLDLEYGVPTDARGGFAKLTDLYGRAPYVVGDAAEPALQAEVDQVFADLGATFVEQHDQPSHPGDERNGVAILPEAIDAKVAETLDAPDADACAGEPTGASFFDCEIARCAGGATSAPCTVGFKIHDDDFIAEQAWWLTVYRHRAPTWDTSLRADALSASEQDAIWDRYEDVVRRAAARGDDIRALGSRDWAEAR